MYTEILYGQRGWSYLGILLLENAKQPEDVIKYSLLESGFICEGGGLMSLGGRVWVSLFKEHLTIGNGLPIAYTSDCISSFEFWDKIRDAWCC